MVVVAIVAGGSTIMILTTNYDRIIREYHSSNTDKAALAELVEAIDDYHHAAARSFVAVLEPTSQAGLAKVDYEQIERPLQIIKDTHFEESQLSHLKSLASDLRDLLYVAERWSESRMQLELDIQPKKALLQTRISDLHQQLAKIFDKLQLDQINELKAAGATPAKLILLHREELIWISKTTQELGKLELRFDRLSYLSNKDTLIDWKDNYITPSIVLLVKLLKEAPDSIQPQATKCLENLKEITNSAFDYDEILNDETGYITPTPQALYSLIEQLFILSDTRKELHFKVQSGLDEITYQRLRLAELYRQRALLANNLIIKQVSQTTALVGQLSSGALCVLLLIGVVGPLVIRRQVSTLNKLNEDLELARNSAENALRAKSAFLANMSHEIRTPMNGVLGMTQLALESSSPEQVKDCLDTIKSCGEGLLGIINDILDFSKIEAGKLSISKDIIEPRVYLEESTTALSLAANQKQIKMYLSIAPEVPRFFIGDELRIRQIITNLASNAIKFTPAGGRVDLRFKWINAPSRLEIEIQDTGVGIRPELIPNLFTPFSQADSSITKHFGGTGLGLSITKRLAELMDGSISLASTASVGSTFSVVLPAPPYHDDNHRLPTSASSITKLPENRILLVEDNSVNQKLAKRMLEKRGQNVTIANNGNEALEIMARESFDIILMDCQMPGLDGFETTRRLRMRELKGSERVPIIALTASVTAEDRSACIAAGMDDHIAKPIDFQNLEKAIGKFGRQEGKL
jgi:signal transduction histidine kinase/CheY-like chemotaxis protein